MNIAKILKNVPKGTKLYSTLFGDVELLEINNELIHPIRVKLCDRDMLESFTEEGKYNREYPDGDCVLFPSKENRDWNTFTIIKPGDIIFSEGLLYLMKNHNTVIFCYDTIRDIAGYGYKCEVFKNYTFANEEQKEKLFYELKKRNFKYNPIDVSIETIEKENKTSYEFKPFDKVLVRFYETDNWACDYFSHMYGKRYVCSGRGMWDYCIPYNDETKHLVGTNKTI